MKCPHCLVTFHDTWLVVFIGADADGQWGIKRTDCPECHRMTVYLGHAKVNTAFATALAPHQVTSDFMIRPKAPSRSPLPAVVPQRFAEDYKEACVTLADSAKASAALSRRCLQNLLRDHAGVKHSDLFKEIQEVLDSNKLPTDLANAIDAVRVVGNFAARPIKSTNTGEIIEVEPLDAEWQLDTLEALFDFYFVRPEELKKRRDAANAKLAEAGKPPMK
jgi:Domain of unknown function (DUF4145)